MPPDVYEDGLLVAMHVLASSMIILGAFLSVSYVALYIKSSQGRNRLKRKSP